MTLHHFLEHWAITDNPFLGEEARHDPVLARLAGPRGSSLASHQDFEKILGDLSRPTSAIVMGEKGSGKTAIRLQISARVRAFNDAHPSARLLLVDYDDLNPDLDRFHQRVGGKDPSDSFDRFRAHDHIDAILGRVVTRLVDALLLRDDLALGDNPRRDVRRFDPAPRRDLLLLQALYDLAHDAPERTSSLRRLLRLPPPRLQEVWAVLGAFGWAIPLAFWLWGSFVMHDQYHGDWVTYSTLTLGALWLAVVVRAFVWSTLYWRRVGHRLRRQIRVTARTASSFARSLRRLPALARDPARLPTHDSEEVRLDLLQRLRAVLRGFGYSGLLVLMDRVDEPTLVSGDPRRMRSLIWPMLNAKFLQQEGIAFKLLLPTELRHALLKESSAFFQEARLDKQSFVERLNWTGSMLYDLCTARLRACRAKGAPDLTLVDLFAEDVTRQDLVDALDQMHQPRDAFKFLYRCITEHCSNVTTEQAQWRIPRLVLDHVRKQESERVQQLYRGIRPA